MKTRHNGRQDGVLQRKAPGKNVVGGMAAAALIDAEAGRCVALRIKVDDQHLFADSGERSAEIDGGRGFADAALLIGHGQDARVPRRLDLDVAAGHNVIVERRPGDLLRLRRGPAVD